jgi:protein dithiol oxidoreductase (disulfide-forming)
MKFVARLLTFAGLAMVAILVVAPARAADEGIDYVRLPVAQPTETGDKVEVLEIFWYGCPHCWHLEPTMASWVATMPSGAAFRRMPATGPRWDPHARAYYAAEALGKLDKFHEALFKAMQVDKRRIMTEDDLVAFAGEIGIDPKEFRSVYESFAVETKLRKAQELQARYGIDGVPAVIVEGKLRTSPSQAGGTDAFVATLNALVAQEIAAKGSNAQTKSGGGS